MRLTRAGEYAIRCIFHMAGQPRGTLVSRRQISGEMDIPAQFLGKIAQQLARAGIIEIQQGARGGFVLVANPAHLSLLDVIEAVIGEIHLNDCVFRPESCSRSAICTVHTVWETAKRSLRETLDSATFEELTHGQSCMSIGDGKIDHPGCK